MYKRQGFISSSFAIEHDGVTDHVWAVLTPKLSCEPEQSNASLTNMGFEAGLDGWTLGYQTEGIEVSGADEFTSPWEGQAMARVGSSQASSGPAQPRGPNLLCQDFVATQDSESFAFNIFTYDYTGFDEFRFDVAVVAQDGEVLASYSQGAWGQGTSLKTSGWRGASIDTSGHIGETLRLVISSGGTQDSLYAFWAYLDSCLLYTSPSPRD